MQDNRIIFGFLCVITLLGAANLGVNVWQTISSSEPQGVLESESKSLPAAFAGSERDRLFQKFQDNWNTRNLDAIWELFHGYAKIQMNRKDIIAQLQRYRDTFGSIGEGVFSHYEFTQHKDGRDWYHLFYKAKAVDVPGRTLDIRLKVFYLGEEVGFSGFNIDMN